MVPLCPVEAVRSPRSRGGETKGSLKRSLYSWLTLTSGLAPPSSFLSSRPAWVAADLGISSFLPS
jgi:hypothetical protein